MHISEINIQDQKQGYRLNNTKKHDVSFNGFRFRRTPEFIRNFQIRNAREEVINFVNYYFSYDAVKSIRIDDNIQRNKMLYNLAERLHDFQVANPETVIDAPAILGKLSEIINPKNKAQRMILEDTRFSVFDFEELTKLLGTKENENLTVRLLELRDEKGVKLPIIKKLKSILELNKAKELDKEFENFRSYMVLNFDNENFVGELGRELDSKTLSFNPERLDRILDIKRRKLLSNLLNNFSDELLVNSNKKVINFLTEGYSSQVLNVMNDLNEEDMKFFEYLIKTSNGKNVDTRVAILKKSINHIAKIQPFNDFKILFERMEKDASLKKFVEIWSDVESNSKSMTVKELLFYVDKFGSEALAQNADNFINVMNLTRSTDPEAVVEILAKNLKNKYYITSDALSHIKISEKYEGRLSRLRGRIKRFIKYNILKNFAGEALPVRKLNDVKFKDYSLPPSEKPVIEIFEDVTPTAANTTKEVVNKTVTPELKTTVNEKPLIEFVEEVPATPEVNDFIELGTPPKKPVLEMIEDVTPMAEIEQQPEVTKTIVREYKPQDPKISARKLKIFNDAQEIIKSRMKSIQQIEEQAHDYSITATKMRNKYLNELFDYVADIRKAENKRGKKHHSVSNYDVLELYQKIKNYNEKEFRRMLRARTPEGERMYSFDEINKMLDNSMVEHYRMQREMQAAMKEARKPKPTPAGIINSGKTTYQWQQDLESIYGKGKVKMQPVKPLEI